MTTSLKPGDDCTSDLGPGERCEARAGRTPRAVGFLLVSEKLKDPETSRWEDQRRRHI